MVQCEWAICMLLSSRGRGRVFPNRFLARTGAIFVMHFSCSVVHVSYLPTLILIIHKGISTSLTSEDFWLCVQHPQPATNLVQISMQIGWSCSEDAADNLFVVFQRLGYTLISTWWFFLLLWQRELQTDMTCLVLPVSQQAWYSFLLKSEKLWLNNLKCILKPTPCVHVGQPCIHKKIYFFSKDQISCL